MVSLRICSVLALVTAIGVRLEAPRAATATPTIAATGVLPAFTMKSHAFPLPAGNASVCAEQAKNGLGAARHLQNGCNGGYFACGSGSCAGCCPSGLNCCCNQWRVVVLVAIQGPRVARRRSLSNVSAPFPAAVAPRTPGATTTVTAAAAAAPAVSTMRASRHPAPCARRTARRSPCTHFASATSCKPSAQTDASCTRPCTPTCTPASTRWRRPSSSSTRRATTRCA